MIFVGIIASQHRILIIEIIGRGTVEVKSFGYSFMVVALIL
jgi:hypothetical protein